MMQLIITALKAEAMPIIDYYKLEKEMSKFYPYYRGEDLEIICCGVGGGNLKKIIADYFKNGKKEVCQIINIGIAGSSIKSHNIGESFLVNKSINLGFNCENSLSTTAKLNESSILNFFSSRIDTLSNNSPFDIFIVFILKS
mgnify:CR=1 FL=1